MKISKYETQIYRYISVVTFDLLGPGQSQRMKLQLQHIPDRLEKGLLLLLLLLHSPSLNCPRHLVGRML